MLVNKEIVEKELVLHIEGRIDTTTSPDFEAEIVSAFQEHNNIVLDFTGVEYISSAGLRVLLLTHKTAVSKGGCMILKHASEAVNEVFAMTGFDSILNIQ